MSPPSRAALAHAPCPSSEEVAAGGRGRGAALGPPLPRPDSSPALALPLPLYCRAPLINGEIGTTYRAKVFRAGTTTEEGTFRLSTIFGQPWNTSITALPVRPTASAGRCLAASGRSLHTLPHMASRWPAHPWPGLLQRSSRRSPPCPFPSVLAAMQPGTYELVFESSNVNGAGPTSARTASFVVGEPAPQPALRCR